jgi:glucose-6-phosphate-specific signal transduction histidine kinase
MQEIYFGKLIASLVPGYLATIVGFSLYSLVVNLIVGPKLGRLFFPTAGWILLIIWVIPPVIAVAISLVLRMSARMRSAAAAQQSSSLVTLPIIVVSYTVAIRVVSDPGPSAILIGGVGWFIAILLSLRGAQKMRRERLLGVAAET